MRVSLSSFDTVMIFDHEHSVPLNGVNREHPDIIITMNATEIWRVIPSAPDYAVSSLGNVKRISQRNRTGNRFANVLKIRIHPEGYRVTQLMVSGRPRHKRVARLLCEAFYGPCPQGKVAAHRNGIRHDDRLENLKWLTVKENSEDTVMHGNSARGERSSRAKLTTPAIIKIRERRASGIIWRKIAEEFGVSIRLIRDVANGKRWVHV